MKDKESSELWAAICQVRDILESLDERCGVLKERDKLTSGIYHRITVKGIGKLNGLVDVAWRDSQREETKP